MLLPSAASLNDKWRRSVVANWHTAFDGRFPFAASKSDASCRCWLSLCAKTAGESNVFSTELNGVLHKEGSQWVPDKVNSHGLVFNPAFLRAINQLSQLSDILFTDGSQGSALSYRPACPGGCRDTADDRRPKVALFQSDGRLADFPLAGETYKPGTLLTWTTVNAGTRLFGDYSGTGVLFAGWSRVNAIRWIAASG